MQSTTSCLRHVGHWLGAQPSIQYYGTESDCVRECRPQVLFSTFHTSKGCMWLSHLMLSPVPGSRAHPMKCSSMGQLAAAHAWSSTRHREPGDVSHWVKLVQAAEQLPVYCRLGHVLGPPHACLSCKASRAAGTAWQHVTQAFEQPGRACVVRAAVRQQSTQSDLSLWRMVLSLWMIPAASASASASARGVAQVVGRGELFSYQGLSLTVSLMVQVDHYK